jgi:hypothetical protein
MIATAPSPESQDQQRRYAGLLENGDHLSACEFLRRYEQAPERTKAYQWNRLFGIARATESTR